MLTLGIFICILGGVGLLIRSSKNRPVEISESDSEDEAAKKLQAIELWEKRRDRASQMLFGGIVLIFISVLLLVLLSRL